MWSFLAIYEATFGIKMLSVLCKGCHNECECVAHTHTHIDTLSLIDMLQVGSAQKCFNGRSINPCNWHGLKQQHLAAALNTNSLHSEQSCKKAVIKNTFNWRKDYNKSPCIYMTFCLSNLKN